MSTIATSRKRSGRSYGSILRCARAFAGRWQLGAVHFQFARWITSGGEARQHVERCVAIMAGHLMAVEFRNVSWWTDKTRDSTLAFEREYGGERRRRLPARVRQQCAGGVGGHVCGARHRADARAQRANLGEEGLKASSDRLNYDYSDGELQEPTGRIKALSSQVCTVHAIMNNNYQDQGQRNARTLMQFL